MIRQIWKVRNTAGDPPKPSPAATEEAVSAILTTQNDESQREMTGAASEGAMQPSADDPRKKSEQEKKREALLGKVSADTALSVCAYNPVSGTVYALVEPDSQAVATDAAIDATRGEEAMQGALPTTRAPPGVLKMPVALAAANSSPEVQSQEERKGEPAGSQPAALPASEVGQPSSFNSMRDQDAGVALHHPFALAKTSEKAESSNQAPQVSYANSLRFSPTLSSALVVITNNGKFASPNSPVQLSFPSVAS